MPDSMTTGVLNALNRNRNRGVCKECGFPMPIYPGRYPSSCPGCGTDRDSLPLAVQQGARDAGREPNSGYGVGTDTGGTPFKG